MKTGEHGAWQRASLGPDIAGPARAEQFEDAAAGEDAVEDGLHKVGVVEDAGPGREPPHPAR